MQIVIIGVGFLLEEVDWFRCFFVIFKKYGNVSEFCMWFMCGMKKNGYDEDFVVCCFFQIEGFGFYGFFESYVVSFVLLVYVLVWIKCYYFGIFVCVLLNF